MLDTDHQLRWSTVQIFSSILGTSGWNLNAYLLRGRVHFGFLINFILALQIALCKTSSLLPMNSIYSNIETLSISIILSQTFQTPMEYLKRIVSTPSAEIFTTLRVFIIWKSRGFSRTSKLGEEMWKLFFAFYSVFLPIMRRRKIQFKSAKRKKDGG